MERNLNGEPYYLNTEERKSIINQIDNEMNQASDEALWGKPASDIITRIESMENAKSARAIWEMVQNARDISKKAGVNIEFSLNNNEFVFRHNGLPFTATSLNALNIQTSSKVRDDIAQVGQYGTGFLTTHKFGLKFNLKGSLELCNRTKYFDFDGLSFDRSPRDKKSMIDNLKVQQSNIKHMCTNPENVKHLKNAPREFTTFRYRQEHDIERERAREAFEQAQNLTPHVLALNGLINSICYRDETTGKESSFIRQPIRVIEENDLYTFSMVETHISRNYDEGKLLPREYDYQIYMLESTQKEERTGSNMVTVILPLMKETVEVERIHLFRFHPNIPNFFIYLPLLGTENWGVNFLFHSPAFTCADESRSSLRFVGNGQNNDTQADQNREIIKLGENMIFSFIETHLDQFTDRKMFTFVNINKDVGNPKLSNYLKEKKHFWVDKMNDYNLVRSSSEEGKYVKPSSIFGLSREMIDEGYRNPSFLDAVYRMLMTKYADRLPAKEELLFWSDRIMEWYDGDVENKHVFTVQDVINLIKEKNDITTLGRENLLEFNKFLASTKQFSFFENYAIVPNESGILKKKADLVCPSTFNKTTRKVMAVLVPEDFAKFVDPDFAGLTQFAVFSDEELKVKFSDAISKIQEGQKGYRDKLRRYTILRSYSDSVSHPEYAIVSKEKVDAMIRFASMIIKPESSSNEANILDLVKEYHGFTEKVTDSLNEFEVRSALRTLIGDAMYRFTLNPDDGEKAVWAQRTIEAVYTYNDFRSMLRDYKLYQDQNGNYRYAEQLREESEIPERLKEIYDIIVLEGNSKSIKDELLDNKYEHCFEGDGECNGAELSAKVFEKISAKRDDEEKSYPDISAYSHRSEVLEIIRRMDDSEEGRQWASLFTTLEKDKATVTMSVIDDGDKKDSIFKFMQEEDTDKLKALADISEKIKSVDSIQAIADIANAEDLSNILAIAKKLNEERQETERQFYFKYTIGKVIEDELRRAVSNELSCNYSTSDVQNGQDMVISYMGRPLYFLECKTKWNFSDPAHMSSQQMKQAVRKKGRYALCCVDCTADTGAKVPMSASKDEVIAAHDDIIAHTYIHTNIGEILSPALSPIIKEEDAFNNIEDDSNIKIRGDLSSYIPKKVFVNGTSFKEFIRTLMTQLRDEIADKGNN